MVWLPVALRLLLSAALGLATGALPYGSSIASRLVRFHPWDLALVLMPFGGALAAAVMAGAMTDQLMFTTWVGGAVATVGRMLPQAWEVKAFRAVWALPLGMAAGLGILLLGA